MNNPGAEAGLPMALTVCYHPCHEAGGDSVSFFALDASRVLIVAADVSGHDLKSAFISAYFQGMLRGMVEQHASIKDVLDRKAAALGAYVSQIRPIPPDTRPVLSQEFTSEFGLPEEYLFER